jgi:hypothetical protein
MIPEGYLNLYNDGWMHRDVSYGNIMLMKEKTMRQAFNADAQFPE